MENYINNAETVSQVEQTKPTKPAKQGGNHAKRNVIIGVIVAIVAVMLAAALWLFVDSTKAVNDYIDEVNNQYQTVADNKDADKPNVTLRSVMLGEVLNAKYKKTKELDGEYQQLINSLRNYTITMDIHNQMVAKFNAGIQGGEVLNGDILTLVNQMANLVQNKYPKQQEQLTALRNLSQKITENTSFADISSDVNNVLHSNDAWLNTEREAIEKAREQFQSKINAV